MSNPSAISRKLQKRAGLGSGLRAGGDRAARTPARNLNLNLAPFPPGSGTDTVGLGDAWILSPRLKSVVPNPSLALSDCGGAARNPPEASGHFTRGVRNLPEASRHFTRAVRNPPEAFGDFARGVRNIRQPNTGVGTVPRSVRNCVRHFGCKQPGTLWHNPEVGIASRKVRNPVPHFGIEVLRIIIHLRPLGTRPGQPKETGRLLPSAPTNLPDTYPQGGRPPTGKAALRAASSHQTEQGRAQHGPTGIAMRPLPFSFSLFAFAFPRLLLP